MPTEAERMSLWRRRDFLLYWSGQTVNEFGTQVSWLAIPLVAIATLHASSFEVAALSAAGALPVLLFALPAGAIVDRTRRRPMMIGTSLGCALAMGSVPLAAASGHATIAQLYVVALVVGTLAIFFDSAASTLPLLMFGHDQVLDATGKMMTARGLAEMAGPSAGGFLVGVLGAARAVTVDAGSYVFSAVTVALMRFREPKPEPRHPEASFRTEISEGLKLVFTDPLMRVLMTANGLASFLLSGVSALWLLYVIRELHWSVHAAGLVYGLSLIGGVAGSMIAKPVTERVGMGRAMIIGALLSAPLEVVTALVSPGLAGQWIVAVAFTALTCSGMVNMVATGTVRQLICPPELLGRMTATNRFVAGTLRFFGPLAAGGLGTWIGLRPTLIILATATLSSGVLLFLSPIRTMREAPVHEAYSESESRSESQSASV